MAHRPYRLVIATLLMVLPAGCGRFVLAPDDPATLTPIADAEGFIPLFNGKDLSGWVPVNVAPGTFSVKENGIIYCTGVPTGVMRSQRMYDNFIVELEWRHLVPRGNAGFFVWSDAITSKGVPFTRSVEIQVLDGPNHPERRYTTHGDVFPIHGATMKPDNPGKSGSQRSYPTEDRSKPAGQWNHYRIECQDGVVKLHVNGKLVTSGRDASPRKGYICLESEGGKVEWRNLRIKELPPSINLDPKHVAKENVGFKCQYDGITLDGWKTAGGAKAAWTPKDWVLSFDPAKLDKDADPTLWLPGEHQDFELIFDLRTTADVDLLLPGASPLTIPASQSKNWRRVHVTASAGRITSTIDDTAGPSFQTPGASGPTGFHPSAQADFANIYLRKLNRRPQ